MVTSWYGHRVLTCPQAPIGFDTPMEQRDRNQWRYPPVRSTDRTHQNHPRYSDRTNASHARVPLWRPELVLGRSERNRSAPATCRPIALHRKTGSCRPRRNGNRSRHCLPMEHIFLVVICNSVVLLTTATGLASPPANHDDFTQNRPLVLRVVPS